MTLLNRRTVIAGALAATFSAQSNLTTAQKPSMPYLLKLPNHMGDVNFDGLVNHSGQSIDASYTHDELEGKNIVLYFGFPECTWFCPSSKQAVKTALQKFPDDNMVGIFIPSQEKAPGQPYTAQEMAQWMDSFKGSGVDIIGVTSPVDKIDRLKDLRKRMHILNPKGVHVPNVFVFNASGDFVGTAPAVTEPKDYSQKPPPAPQNIERLLIERLGLTPKENNQNFIPR